MRYVAIAMQESSQITLRIMTQGALEARVKTEASVELPCEEVMTLEMDKDVSVPLCVAISSF